MSVYKMHLYSFMLYVKNIKKSLNLGNYLNYSCNVYLSVRLKYIRNLRVGFISLKYTQLYLKVHIFSQY